MKIKIGHLVAAAALIGALGFGGVALASAQEGSTTTTTPSTPDDGSSTPDRAAPGDRKNCDHDDQTDGSSDSSDTTDGETQGSSF